MGFFDEERESSAGMMGYEEIRDPGQILRFLQKALVDEENVEVQINDRTRTFFTYFMDHLPDLVAKDQPTTHQESGEPPIEPVLVEPPYEPFSYMRDRTRLVIAPLVPAIGNSQIRQSAEVLVRFFQGVKAMEAVVKFANTLDVRGEPAIQLTYPSSIWLLRKRRHFRAKVPTEQGVRLIVHKAGQEDTEVTIIDLSVGGAGFCNPIDPEQLPIGEPVTLQIMVPELHPLKINAFIRNHMRATTKDGCRVKGAMRCGVQFDIVNEHQAMEIEEMVALVQREQLQQNQDRKAAARKAAAAHEREPKKASLSDELTKMLGLKKKFFFR